MTTESKLIAKVMTQGAKKASDELDNFSKSAGKADDSSKFLSRMAIPAAVIGSFVTLGNATMAAAAEVDGMADAAYRLGLSLQEFQKNNYVFEQFGVSGGEATKILLKFEKSAQDAMEGTGALGRALDKLGGKVQLTADDFNGLSGSDGLALLVKKMQDANIPMKEQIAIMDSISRGSSKLHAAYKDNAEALDKLSSRYDEFNESSKLSDEQIDAFGELDENVNLLSQTFDNLTNNILADFAPVVNAAINTMLIGLDKLNEAWNFVSDGIRTASENMSAKDLAEAIDKNGMATSVEGIKAQIDVLSGGGLQYQHIILKLKVRLKELEGAGNGAANGMNNVNSAIGSTSEAAVKAVSDLADLQIAMAKGGDLDAQIKSQKESLKVTEGQIKALERKAIVADGIARKDAKGNRNTTSASLYDIMTDTTDDQLGEHNEAISKLSEAQLKLFNEWVTLANRQYVEQIRLSELTDQKTKNNLDTALKSYREQERAAKVSHDIKIRLADTELEKIKLNAEEEKRIAGMSRKTGLLNKQQYDDTLVAIEKETAAKIKEIKDEEEAENEAVRLEDKRKADESAQYKKVLRDQAFAIDAEYRFGYMAAQEIWYTEQLNNLIEAREKEAINDNVYRERKIALDAEAARRTTKLKLEEELKYTKGVASMLSAQSSLMDTFYEKRHAAREAAGKDDTSSMVKQWRLSKTFLLASATLSAYAASVQAFADPSATTVAGKFAAYATTIAGAMNVVQQAMSVEWTPGRSQGGQFSAGQYLVGEKGPELVRFGGSGRIADANQTAAMMGGGTTPNITIVNQTSGRIDTVEQSMDRGQMVLVIKEVMAAETFDPNSKFNRALSKTRTAGRKL